MSKRIEIRPGDEYGRLTILREVSAKSSGKQVQRSFECRCECGVVKEYRLYMLRNGNTRSCGCLARDVAGAGMRTHGLSHTDEYGIWQGMLNRCNKSFDSAYSHYGVRGISVCERWSSFESFYGDMGPRPSPKHSIDRVNNDGNYEPGNCRWATSKEQARNKRVNYLVEHDGETKCVADWAEQYGVSQFVLYSRLVKLGWTFDESVSRRVHSRRSTDPFYMTPMKNRGPDWQREHARRESKRIALDRLELERYGDSLAVTHRVDATEFKARVDAVLVEGWQRKNAIYRALREMGAVS